MDDQLLSKSIEALIVLRLELHGSVDDGVVETLDKVIADLEAAKSEPSKISAQDVLRLIGTILEKLPAIVEIIHMLSNVFQ